MSLFVIPSLDQISASLRALVPSLISGARADYFPNNLVIAAKVTTMAVREALLRVRWVYRTRFVRLADAAHLDMHGEEVGLVRVPARPALGNVTLTATATITLPAGSELVSIAGIRYVTLGSVTAPLGVATPVGVAAVETGAAGNAPAGLTLTPGPGVVFSGTMVFAAGAAGGSEREQDEPYRARLIARMAARPRGGNADDYDIWLRETGLFDAVFVRGWHPAAGRVTIYPLKPGSGAMRIPSPAELEIAADYLEPRRPLAAEVILAQATARPIDIAIDDLETDTETVRREIHAELADMFDERARPALPGAGDTFPTSWIVEAISRAIGENRHALVTPAAPVVLAAGEYPVLGTVTYS